ncbi:MAG TPA: LssY C-terminal domain-containing protein [Pirellulales bacterium]|nr:LssY C-terminal domain-containing protein [Pirellulales bacterium]
METLSTQGRRSHRVKKPVMAVAVFLLVYLVIAYGVLPFGWLRYESHHPSLDSVPNITRTRDDIPGDPLNVALIGSETEVKKIFVKAGWYPADPLTMRSCLEIAEASVLRRPYDEAPVSNLYLYGRKEDLAFEFPVGDDPRQRHHVRLWKSPVTDADGRPVWVGSATYDMRVGLSHTTGEVTHHIAPDIDVERDHLFASLKATDDLAEIYNIPDFHKVREGRNGGGDPWHTDGNLTVGIIAQAP